MYRHIYNIIVNNKNKNWNQPNLFKKTFYFVLGYSWLTRLWQFQVNTKGIQPYIYMYQFSPQTPLPFRLPHNIEQSFMCYTVGPRVRGSLGPQVLCWCWRRKQWDCFKKCQKQEMTRTSLVVQWLRLQATKSGGLGLILGQEARIHMLQQRSKIRPAKTWCSQINRYIF